MTATRLLRCLAGVLFLASLACEPKAAVAPPAPPAPPASPAPPTSPAVSASPPAPASPVAVSHDVASGTPAFTGDPLRCDSDGDCVTTCNHPEYCCMHQCRQNCGYAVNRGALDEVTRRHNAACSGHRCPAVGCRLDTTRYNAACVAHSCVAQPFNMHDLMRRPPG